MTDQTATLNATVNNNSDRISQTSYAFQYGTDTSYGSQTPLQIHAISGTMPVDVSATITSLSPNTEYHYRIVANNERGITYGFDQTFTTSPAVGPDE